MGARIKQKCAPHDVVGTIKVAGPGCALEATQAQIPENMSEREG
jgi:hypothetical protein